MQNLMKLAMMSCVYMELLFAVCFPWRSLKVPLEETYTKVSRDDCSREEGVGRPPNTGSVCSRDVAVPYLTFFCLHCYSTWENQLELKELASLEGAPQGIKALVATMQHLSKQQRTGRFFTEEDKGEMPPNMQQALETLRSMRSSAKNEAEPDGSDEQDKASPQQVTKEDLERLENHLKTYIDNAVDRAQKSLEKKIDLLAGSLEVLVTQLINIKS